MPTTTTTSGLLRAYPHLTGRDRQLLALLDAHRVLTTGQIHRLLFTALRTCQIRLAALRRLGLLERFRFARDGGGSQPWHWTLGHAGALLQAAATGRPPPTAHAHADQLLRRSASPTLGHLVTTNEFFVGLAHHARTHPGTRLDRWWSEPQAAARFPGIHPDGHGLWTRNGTTVGFHLETDHGTEPLTRLLTKLDAYQRLIHAGGPHYPVLFWLPTRQREANLQRALSAHPPSVLVATATHHTHPAGPVWLPAGAPWRARLADLPCWHGQPTATNPNWTHGHLNLTNQT